MILFITPIGCCRKWFDEVGKSADYRLHPSKELERPQDDNPFQGRDTYMSTDQTTRFLTFSARADNIAETMPNVLHIIAK